MAKVGSDKVSFFLIDGLNVVGTRTTFDDRREAKTERTDGLGDAWETHGFAGIRMAEISQDGFYDDAAGSIHDALSSGPGVSPILSYALEGTATGKAFVGWAAGVQVNYQRQVSRDAMHKALAVYKGDGPVDEGKILFSWQAASATGQKNSVDGVAETTGGAGYLHYSASAGEANIRIMHSSDDISFAALFTFTKTASGHGSERLTTTGAIKRYTAADFTTVSATGSIGALNAFVGLVRGLTS